MNLDIEGYEGLRDAAVLLQMAAEGERDLKVGRVLPQEQALERIRSRIKEK